MSAVPTRRPFVFFGVAAIILGLLWWLWPQSAERTGDEAEQSQARRDDNGRFAQVRGDAKKMLPVWGDRTASIAGTVTDPAGGPVADAQVCASTNERDLPSSQRREPSCTTTDEQGRYFIGDLFGVDYNVSASAPRYRPTVWRVDADSRIRLTAGQQRTGIDITLREGGVLVEGVVMDAAGGVIEGALVSSGGWWRSSRLDGQAFTRTDDDGAYSLWVGPGDIQVGASADGYNDGNRSGRAPTKGFDIHLVPESILVGRVVMIDTNRPVENAIVEADSNSWGGRGGTAVTDAQGRFRLDRLEPGIYKPSATAETGRGQAEVSVHLGLSETSEEVVIALHPAVTIRGKVIVADSDAEPCTEGSVELADKDLDIEAHDGVGPDGSVEFKGMLPGTYEVTVSCDDFVRREHYDDLVVGTEPIEGVVWEVDAGRSIRGTVADAAGEPIAEGRVWAQKTGGGARDAVFFGSSGELQPDGTFEIRGLQPGRYRVTATPEESHGIKAEQEVEVTQSADTEGVELELPASGTIAGRVEDDAGQPVGGVQVSTQGPVRGGGRVYTADDGMFEIPAVPVGRHRVIARHDWGDTLRKPGTSDDDVQGESVEVEAGETAEVTIVVESTDGSVSGRVVDEDGGPVADAFIQTERESDSATAGEGNTRRRVRWGGWNEQPVLTDQDGSFTVDGLTAGASYTVRAYRKGGGEALLEQVAEGSTGIELRLEGTGSVSGRVVLGSGAAPDTFTVTLADDEQGVHRNERFFRTEGRFAFERLPPGHYDLSVNTTKGDATTEVELAAGADVEGVELELTSRVTVKGQLVDLETREPVPGMVVNMGPSKGRMQFSFGPGGDKEHITDEQGNFVIENAPTGRVRLIVIPKDFGANEGYSFTWAKATIPEEDPYQMPPVGLVKQRVARDEQAGDLGFELKQVDAGKEAEEEPVVIGFVRPGGPAQAAGLKAGETIVAVDGHDVTGEHRSRYGPLTRVAAGTKLTFEIEGEAGKRTVTVVAGKPV